MRETIHVVNLDASWKEFSSDVLAVFICNNSCNASGPIILVNYQLKASLPQSMESGTGWSVNSGPLTSNGPLFDADVDC